MYLHSVMWLVFIVLCLIIEMATLGLTTIWFAFGSLVAFFSTFAGAGIWTQLTLFSIVSALMLIFTRPVVLRHFNNKRIKTNCDSLIGRMVMLKERVDNVERTGAANLDGKTWTVRSADDFTVIEAGEMAIVKEIRGVKLIVERCDYEKKENA